MLNNTLRICVPPTSTSPYALQRYANDAVALMDDVFSRSSPRRQQRGDHVTAVCARAERAVAPRRNDRPGLAAWVSVRLVPDVLPQ
jgi:hypothetical protein